MSLFEDNLMATIRDLRQRIGDLELLDRPVTTTLAASATLISAGVGLTGGGSLAVDRTIAMGTPSSLSQSTSNAAVGSSHSHAITSSSNPGAAAALLASSAAGKLTLVEAAITTLTATNLTINSVASAPQIGSRVYNNSAISINNLSATALTFDTERFDTDSMHSTSSNTGRLTAGRNGVFTVGACIQWATNVTGERFLGLRLNGTDYIASDRRTPASDTAQTVSTTWSMTAGDYVEVVVLQSSGGALNVLATVARSPEFWMVRMF